MRDFHACPCDGCDGETLDPDEYCVECMHYDCGPEPQCTEEQIATQAINDVNEEMDRGEHECPSCGSVMGLFDRGSCSVCSYIPEENRV